MAQPQRMAGANHLPRFQVLRTPSSSKRRKRSAEESNSSIQHHLPGYSFQFLKNAGMRLQISEMDNNDSAAKKAILPSSFSTDVSFLLVEATIGSIHNLSCWFFLYHHAGLSRFLKLRLHAQFPVWASSYCRTHMNSW